MSTTVLHLFGVHLELDLRVVCHLFGLRILQCSCLYQMGEAKASAVAVCPLLREFKEANARWF